MRHYFIAPIAFWLCASCEISDVSKLDADLFACQKANDCVDGDAGLRPEAAISDVDPVDVGTDVGFVDAMPDAGFMDDAMPDVGFMMDAMVDVGFMMDAMPDTGPNIIADGGRDAGFGFDVGTSASCDWLSSGPVASGSRPCDKPTKIVPGKHHTCAIRESGSVVCWGKNDDGQLGNGTNISSRYPVTVLGVTTTSTSGLAIGENHSCVLDTANTVWCWGKNDKGQAGAPISTHPNISYPVQIRDDQGQILSGVTKIASGLNHTCALQPVGGSRSIYCWGDNFFA